MDFVRCTAFFAINEPMPEDTPGSSPTLERTTDAAADLRESLERVRVLCARARVALREESTSDKAELSDAK